MVKRLIGFLFIVCIGFSVEACAQTSNAQTEATKKNAQEESATDPVTLNQDTPKKDESQKDPSKQDSSKQDSSKQDSSKQDASKKDASKKDAPKQEELRKDSSKQDPAKTADSKKALPATDDPAQDTDSTDKDAPPKVESKQDKSKQDKDAPPKVAVPAESVPPTVAPKMPAKPLDQAGTPEATNKLLSEHLLPPSTKLWVSIPDSKQLAKQFDETQFGLLAKDEAIKPFIESFRQQVKDYLSGQNVRLGMDVDDLGDIQTGEICVAGVLPELDGKQPAQTAHGIVLLVDVSNTEQQAKDLLKKVNAELKKLGAKQEVLEINKVEYRKSTLNNPRRFRPTQCSFQAIVNGWMLVSDNEKIFRDVLRRLATPSKIKKAETLSAQPAFVEVMKQADLGKESAQIRWFVDPFGYLQLAQALEEQDSAIRGAHNDWAGKLRNNGFDALQGVGGNISIATSEHELLHRTFIFAPNDPKSQDSKHVFDLFDFGFEDDRPLTPAKWVPADCSDYFVAKWNMSRALKGFGVIYDGLFEEGEFERMLSDFRVDPDMQLDVTKLIGLMNNRVTVVSSVERPITETSERICIGIPITGEPKFVFDSIKRATRGQVINLGGIEVIKVDAREQDLSDDPDLDLFELEGDLEEEEEEEERQFKLFETKFIVVRDGHLLIANNKDFLRKLMTQKVSKLTECPDYIEIKDAIGKLTDDEKVSFRQFGRIDQALETNYEMLRRGEMGKSQTVLARVVNQIFAKAAAEKAAAEGTKSDPDVVRNQKLDGSKLPNDYAKSIAPYFGPTGWVLETEKAGWRITGCILKKKEMTEVVQKVDDDKKSQR